MAYLSGKKGFYKIDILKPSARRPVLESNRMDIEIKSQPFTKEYLKKIKKDLYSGRIRRFGAVVNHQKLDYSYNALIAWAKPLLSQSLNQKLKDRGYISHIYLRKAHRVWPYRLYTMVHAQSRIELDSHVLELSQLLGRLKFKVLKTIKEFKKISFYPYP